MKNINSDTIFTLCKSFALLLFAGSLFVFSLSTVVANDPPTEQSTRSMIDQQRAVQGVAIGDKVAIFGLSQNGSNCQVAIFDSQGNYVGFGSTAWR